MFNDFKKKKMRKKMDAVNPVLLKFKKNDYEIEKLVRKHIFFKKR